MTVGKKKAQGFDASFDALALPKLSVGARDIPAEGLEREYKADRAECAALSQVIDLGAISEFQAAYAITPDSKNRFRIKAHLRARISQNCVVTLAPLENAIEEDFTALFVSEDILEKILGDEDFDAEGDENPEPIVNGRLEVGRIIYEHLAGAINPYPRAKDAEISQENGMEGTGGTDADGPFSVLAELRKDGGKS